MHFRVQGFSWKILPMAGMGVEELLHVQPKVKEGFMCCLNCILSDLQFDYMYVCAVQFLCCSFLYVLNGGFLFHPEPQYCRRQLLYGSVFLPNLNSMLTSFSLISYSLFCVCVFNLTIFIGINGNYDFSKNIESRRKLSICEIWRSKMISQFQHISLQKIL